MAGKTHEEYAELLTAVVAACRKFGYNPDPTTVTTDFEQSVMRAVQDVLGHHVEHKGCFYHLSQSTWRKVSYLTLFLLQHIILDWIKFG
jgi:hypothetical protein